MRKTATMIRMAIRVTSITTTNTTTKLKADNHHKGTDMMGRNALIVCFQLLETGS